MKRVFLVTICLLLPAFAFAGVADHTCVVRIDQGPVVFSTRPQGSNGWHYTAWDSINLRYDIDSLVYGPLAPDYWTGSFHFFYYDPTDSAWHIKVVGYPDNYISSPVVSALEEYPTVPPETTREEMENLSPSCSTGSDPCDTAISPDCQATAANPDPGACPNKKSLISLSD